MRNDCASFWFPMQQVGKCACGELPVMQNYKIPGRKIKFGSFFVEQNFQYYQLFVESVDSSLVSVCFM